jgi:hypothetical protein
MCRIIHFFLTHYYCSDLGRVILPTVFDVVKLNKDLYFYGTKKT